MGIVIGDLLAEIDFVLKSQKKQFDNRPDLPKGFVYKKSNYEKTGQYLSPEQIVNLYVHIMNKVCVMASNERKYIVEMVEIAFRFLQEKETMPKE